MKQEAFEKAKKRHFRLTADQRHVMNLFYDEGRPQVLSVSEVAEKLSRSRQAVRFSLKRLEAAGILDRTSEGGKDFFSPTEKAGEILGVIRGRWSLEELRT